MPDFTFQDTPRFAKRQECSFCDRAHAPFVELPLRAELLASLNGDGAMYVCHSCLETILGLAGAVSERRLTAEGGRADEAEQRVRALEGRTGGLTAEVKRLEQQLVEAKACAESAEAVNARLSERIAELEESPAVAARRALIERLNGAAQFEPTPISVPAPRPRKRAA